MTETARALAALSEPIETLDHDAILLFVNGTLMRGLSLHHNLDGARFITERRTAECYRLHSIGDVHPGMYPVAENGVAVLGELYEVPSETWARVAAGEPPGLYRGPVVLDDGQVVDGILYPRELTAGHPDISHFGAWRAYLASTTSSHGRCGRHA